MNNEQEGKRKKGGRVREGGKPKVSKWEGCKMLISATQLVQEGVGTEGRQQLVR